LAKSFQVNSRMTKFSFLAQAYLFKHLSSLAKSFQVNSRMTKFSFLAFASVASAARNLLDVDVFANATVFAANSCESTETTYLKMKKDVEKRMSKGSDVDDPKLVVSLLRATRNLKSASRKACAWVKDKNVATDDTPFMSKSVSDELSKRPCAPQANDFISQGKYILAADAWLADEDECSKLGSRVSPALTSDGQADASDDAAEMEAQLVGQAGGVSLLETSVEGGSGKTILRVILALLFMPIWLPAAILYFIMTAIMCIFKRGGWSGCMNSYWGGTAFDDLF